MFVRPEQYEKVLSRVDKRSIKTKTVIVAQEFVERVEEVRMGVRAKERPFIRSRVKLISRIDDHDAGIPGSSAREMTQTQESAPGGAVVDVPTNVH